MTRKKKDETPQQHHEAHEPRTASDMHCRELLESGFFSFISSFFSSISKHGGSLSNYPLLPVSYGRVCVRSMERSIQQANSKATYCAWDGMIWKLE